MNDVAKATILFIISRFRWLFFTESKKTAELFLMHVSDYNVVNFWHFYFTKTVAMPILDKYHFRIGINWR